MAGRFNFSRPERRGVTDPWFRIGEIDVGSAGFLSLLCAVSLFIYGFEPVDKPILTRLALIPDRVLDGQIWRLFTWPLANGFDSRLLWTAIAIALLWYFGNRLEDQVGRARMTWLLMIIIVMPAILGTLLDLPQAGVRSVEIAILLIFIAEYPHMRFFFGIPAWALGAFYVVTDILQISGAGATRQLLFYVVSLVIAALAARSVGMLTAYPWLPRVPLPLTPGGSSGSRTHRSKPKRKKRSKPNRSSGKVVEGPWSPPPPPSAPSPDATAAQTELDGLLDKISAGGLESLSSDEKRRLNELSKRLR